MKKGNSIAMAVKPKMRSFPVFCDVKGPVELQVGSTVVVGEYTRRVITASRKKATWSLLRRKLLLIRWIFSGVWWVATDHLLILAYPDAFPLDNLNIFEPAKHFMLYDEDGFHLIFTALFDGEWFVFECLKGAGSGEVNRDVRSSLDFLEVTRVSKIAGVNRRTDAVPKQGI